MKGGYGVVLWLRLIYESLFSHQLIYYYIFTHQNHFVNIQKRLHVKLSITTILITYLCMYACNYNSIKKRL